MPGVPKKSDEIFPKGSTKTYGLMELVRGIAPPVERGEAEDSVTTWPYLLIMEIIAALGTTVFLLLWSLLQNAPLRELANPDVTENPAKAPWYFLGLQELLLHMHPALAGVIVPSILILFLIVLPYIDRDRKDVGHWWASRQGWRIALFSSVYTAVLTAGLIILDELYPMANLFKGQGPFFEQTVRGWIVPLLVMGFLTILLLFIVGRIWRPTIREYMIAVFSGFVSTTVVLTISGSVFRGPGMRLVSPGQIMDWWDLVGFGLFVVIGGLLVWVLYEPKAQRS